MNLPNIRKTPVATLQEIDKYCARKGCFSSIADTLHLEPEEFSQLMSWYLLHLRETFSSTLPDPQELLNLILLLLLEKSRQQNIKLAKEITAIRQKINRLHTPWKE